MKIADQLNTPVSGLWLTWDCTPIREPRFFVRIRLNREESYLSRSMFRAAAISSADMVWSMAIIDDQISGTSIGDMELETELVDRRIESADKSPTFTSQRCL